MYSTIVSRGIKPGEEIMMTAYIETFLKTNNVRDISVSYYNMDDYLDEEDKELFFSSIEEEKIDWCKFDNKSKILSLFAIINGYMTGVTLDLNREFKFENTIIEAK